MAGIEWSTLSVNGRPMASILVFFAGITIARLGWCLEGNVNFEALGVWLMDLSVMQIMQEGIIETERMTVFGIENSMCKLLAVCKDLIVIMFPDKRIFGLLVWISVLFVFAGFLNYVLYFVRVSFL